MDYSISTNQVASRGQYRDQMNKAKQGVRENSGEIAVGGAVGTATFSTLRNSSRIGNSAVKLVQESKLIQASKKAKILRIFERGKFMSHPIVRKIAGPLAAFAALSTVVASAAKIADTCQYIESTKQPNE